MITREIIDIGIEKKALKDRLDRLKDREHKAMRELRELEDLAKADNVLKEDAKESEVNYVLGHSEGYVSGFNAAIAVITDCLASEYRDIPVTEDELYMLVELGELRSMAKQKDMKSKRIAEKAGWKFNWNMPFPTWEKSQEEHKGEGVEDE